jgi:CRISPR-associated endonuclease/helicase Cas3
LPLWLDQIAVPRPPAFIGTDKRKLALWIRLVFSALVDADFLDTENFYQGVEREHQLPKLGTLLRLLEVRVAELSRGAGDGPVNAMRRRVMKACEDSAELPQGIFTLTVPTGGAKTLGSLLFALKHAVKCKLKRVIVVVPYTSIIEQTAGVFRDIFGPDAVVEHHSNVDPDHESRQNRIASEN